MDKVKVNGPQACEVYNFLKHGSGDLHPIPWNYTKVSRLRGLAKGYVARLALRVPLTEQLWQSITLFSCCLSLKSSRVLRCLPASTSIPALTSQLAAIITQLLNRDTQQATARAPNRHHVCCKFAGPGVLPCSSSLARMVA
jgi:hypothetical protein